METYGSREGRIMKTKKENSILLLLRWAEKDRGYLISSVICAFLGGLFAIGPYIGIYRLMDAFLTNSCSVQIISENAILITATVIIRQIFQGLLKNLSFVLLTIFLNLLDLQRVQLSFLFIL